MFELNKNIALLTKHKKLEQVQAAFESVWKGSIVLYDKFDTDTLGSFDNKVTRKLKPHECAIKKARLACEFSGLNQGLGSEGSFSGYAGIGNMNEEFVAFVDIKKNVAIAGLSRQMTSLQPINAKNKDELENRLSEYPDTQGWMLTDSNDDVVVKGLVGLGNIIKASNAQFPIAISPDFRAMHCPERQENIKNASKDLIERLSSLCPKCGYPDFIEDKFETGLPCEICQAPTNQKKTIIAHCSSCGFESRRDVNHKTASAYYCNYCNP